MKKEVVVLPYSVKENAIAFADQETGKSRTNPAWKRAFDRYVREAYEHSYTPAKSNPMSSNLEFPNYPEIYGPNGFVSKVTGRSPNKEDKQWTEMANRIKGFVGNIVSLFLKEVMGFQINEKDNADKADKKTLSVFEHIIKSDKSDALTDADIETISAQYTRYLVNSIAYELLIPLFETSAKDVHEIIASTDLVKIDPAQFKGLLNDILRNKFIKHLRARAETKMFKSENIKKMYIK